MLKLVSTFILMASLCLPAYAEQDPQVIVKSVSDVVLAEILANKTKMDEGAEFLSQLVEDKMIPIIDQDKMAKLALGKHWKDITDSQRKDFIAGFKRLLIKTYSGAFKAYTGQDVIYGETKFNKENDKAIVQSDIQMPGSTPIRLQYRLYRVEGEQWLVYDANIAGLGLLKTYRTQFAEQISRDGVEKTIAQLKAVEL